LRVGKANGGIVLKRISMGVALGLALGSPALAQDWMAPNATPKTELLWPGAVPGAVGTEDVDKPTLTIYLPSKGQATGASIVICPGGGYRNLAMDHEGFEVARWLSSRGIAGFVLSVGMAVDANILIFERMKEEMRLGKALPSAVEAGFGRAWNSILDSNVSSLITATILYVFGSSVIRGFALVLIIGVLVSMFSAIVVTRTILRWVVRQEWARKPGLYGLRDDEFVALGAVRPSSRREARARV
jgi:hypothetical protein